MREVAMSNEGGHSNESRDFFVLVAEVMLAQTNFVLITDQQNKFLYTNYSLIHCVYQEILRQQQHNAAEIKEAYALAILLYYIYAKLLNCKQDASKISEDMEHLKKLLKKKEVTSLRLDGVSCVEDKADPVSYNSTRIYFSTHYFRTKLFITLNWLRLCLVRIWRFINLLGQVDRFSRTVAIFVSAINALKSALHFGILACCFYLPRLLLNSFLFLKHVISHPYMSKEEKSLGFILRMQIQWQRRRFQLINDIVWFGANLALLFLNPGLGMILVCGLYLFDVINQYYFDYRPTHEMADKIKNIFNKKSGLCLYDKQRQSKFYLAVAVLLFIGMLPLLSCLPQMLPLIFVGAGLVMLVSILQKMLSCCYVEKTPSIATLTICSDQNLYQYGRGEAGGNEPVLDEESESDASVSQNSEIEPSNDKLIVTEKEYEIVVDFASPLGSPR